MALVVVGAAKGAPGVTTSVLAIASAAWDRAGVLVAECDPAGGDIAALLGYPAEPGMVSLAAAARGGQADALLAATHARRLTSDVQVLCAPPGASQATAALGALARSDPHPVVAAARQPGRLVLADVGRVEPGSPLVAMADQVLVVLRPKFTDVAHAADRIAELASRTRRVGVLIIGRGPYSPAEIAATLRAPLVGVLPQDRAGAAEVARAANGHWGAARTRLARQARGVLDELRPVLPPADAARPGRTSRRTRRIRMLALADQETRS